MKTEKFLVSGGIPRVFGELIAGHVFKEAELAEVDFKDKRYTSHLKYKTPQEFCADKLPSITFGCFFMSETEIYLPTRTEVLIIDRQTYIIKEVLTDPLFNDIHDVHVVKNTLYVAVTGLDAVFSYNLETKQREVVNVLGEYPFTRFNPDENLNKKASLKPHASHPNHLFEIDGEIWVTRLLQKDAICLKNPSKRIKIDIGLPHDGFVKGDLVYFTTVNGYVVIFNIKTLKKVNVIQLTGAKGNGVSLLGWCRGIYVGDTNFYVGFTKLRTTKITENLDWIKNIIGGKKIVSKPLPTRIEKYTLSGKYVAQFILPKNSIYNIFSISAI